MEIHFSCMQQQWNPIRMEECILNCMHTRNSKCHFLETILHLTIYRKKNGKYFSSCVHATFICDSIQIVTTTKKEKNTERDTYGTTKNCWILISSHDVHAQLLKYKNHKNCVWTIRAKKLFVSKHEVVVYPNGMGTVGIYFVERAQCTVGLMRISIVHVVTVMWVLIWNENILAGSIFGNFFMDIIITRFVWYFFPACLKVEKKRNEN